MVCVDYNAIVEGCPTFTCDRRLFCYIRYGPVFVSYFQY